MLTVLRALLSRGFLGASIEAGWKGLGRHVSTVTVAELPDGTDRIYGGELILTSAFWLGKHTSRFRSWVMELEAAGACALVIRPYGSTDQVPEAIIDIADTLKFPIVRLPANVAWPQIIKPLMEIMLKDKCNTVISDSLLDSLRSIIESGNTIHQLEQIVQELADQIRMPVVLSNANCQVRCVGLSACNEEELGFTGSKMLANKAELIIKLLRGRAFFESYSLSKTEIFETNEYTRNITQEGGTIGHISALQKKVHQNLISLN
jgi:hypothetical protein